MSGILNFKYNILNWNFPLVDTYKNYGHNSLYQVVPTLNPINFLIFFTNVKSVLEFQLIFENFIAMMGLYLFLSNFTKNKILLICFSIFYVSVAWNFSSIRFFSKEFYYLPFFLFFFHNFLINKSNNLIYYLIFLNFVTNWAAILFFPTVSFFLYIIYNNNKKIFTAFLFSLLIFFLLPMLWLPIIFENFQSTSSIPGNNFSLISFFSSFLSNFMDSIEYLLSSGIDSFAHPYNGTLGPLYIPLFFYGLITYYFIYLFKFDNYRKYFLYFFLFIIIYFIYFFIFSELFYPMKIRHHILMIPPMIMIISFLLIIKFYNLVSNKILLLFLLFDIIVFGLLSFYEPTKFIHNDPNFIKLNYFFDFKASYALPISNFLIIFIIIKNIRWNIKYLYFILILLIFIQVSLHNAWLNKFDHRAVKLTNKYENYHLQFKDCLGNQDLNSQTILLNSKDRLNDNFILLSNLNKEMNYRVIPEYEETNSTIFGYLHALINDQGDNLLSSLSLNDYNKFSDASNLGYFEIKKITQKKIDFLSRIGVNKIISDIKILGAEKLLVNKCENSKNNIYLYDLVNPSSNVFLSNFKLENTISNSEFFNSQNYKSINIKKIKNNLEISLNNNDLEYKYLYILAAKTPSHKLKINRKIELFLNETVLDKFIVVDLSKIKKDNAIINIYISQNILIVATIFLFFSSILMRRFSSKIDKYNS